MKDSVLGVRAVHLGDERLGPNPPASDVESRRLRSSISSLNMEKLAKWCCMSSAIEMTSDGCRARQHLVEIKVIRHYVLTGNCDCRLVTHLCKLSSSALARSIGYLVTPPSPQPEVVSQPDQRTRPKVKKTRWSCYCPCFHSSESFQVQLRAC